MFGDHVHKKPKKLKKNFYFSQIGRQSTFDFTELFCAINVCRFMELISSQRYDPSARNLRFPSFESSRAGEKKSIKFNISKWRKKFYLSVIWSVVTDSLTNDESVFDFLGAQSSLCMLYEGEKLSGFFNSKRHTIWCIFCCDFFGSNHISSRSSRWSFLRASQKKYQIFSFQQRIRNIQIGSPSLSFYLPPAYTRSRSHNSNKFDGWTDRELMKICILKMTLWVMMLVHELNESINFFSRFRL